MLTAAILLLFSLLCVAMGTGHAWGNETAPARNHLVFAARNRAYGAYQLRDAYGRSMGVALLFAALVPALLGMLPWALRSFTNPMAPASPGKLVVDVDLKRVWTPPPVAPAPATPKSVPATPAPQPPANNRMVVPADSLETPVHRADTIASGISGKRPPSGGAGRDTIPATGTGTGPYTGTMDSYEVQVLPEFPGGAQAMGDWVRRNLDFPDDLKGRDVVYVQFTIGLDGTVADVRAVKWGNASGREAAERAISRMPRWKPARMNGHDVRCRLVLPIKFETW